VAIGLGPVSASGAGVDAAGSVVFTGLTLDSPVDVDYYAFSLSRTPTASDRIVINYVPANGLNFQATLLGSDTPRTFAPVAGMAQFELTGTDMASLSPGTVYHIEIKDNQIPTRYSVRFDFLSSPDKSDGATRNDTRSNAYSLGDLATLSSVTGLSLDSASDVDWFKFSLGFPMRSQWLSTEAVATSLDVVATFKVIFSNGVTGEVNVPVSNSISAIVQAINTELGRVTTKNVHPVGSYIVAETVSGTDSRLRLKLRPDYVGSGLTFRLELLTRAKENPVGKNNEYDADRYAGVLTLVKEKSGWNNAENKKYSRGVAAYFCHASYAAHVVDIVKIDGKPYYGDYGTIPTATIASVNVILNNKDTIALPAAAFADLFHCLHD